MSLSQKGKNTLSFLFRIALSLALLTYVFSMIDIPETVEVLKSADLMYIFYAGMAFMVCMGILLIRWLIFIRALDLPASTKNVILHFFYGASGNLFLPTAIGGDLLKAVGLCKGSEQKPKVIASILLDRISGFASIALVAVIAFIFGYKLIGDNRLLIPIILMGVACSVAAVILLNEKVYTFSCRIFDRFPRFKNSLMTMHYDIALLKESHKYVEAIKAVLLSCLSQVIFAFSYFLTAKALHQDIGIIYFLIFVPIICVISAFPSIGGLGVREWGAAELFALIGVQKGIAVSLSLINFTFMVIVGLVGGILYVYTISTGRVQHYSSDEGVEFSES